MKISELNDNAITDELVDKILFEDLKYYDDRKVDVAVVLGSAKAHIYRLPPVIEAYKNGNIYKIIMSGHTRKIDDRYLNEGCFLRDKALEMGARNDDILVEDKAKNTLENLLFSKRIMFENRLVSFGSVMAVATSSYHMKRSLLIAEKVFSECSLNIISIPGDDVSTKRDSWFKSETGIERCYGEVRKIIWYYRNGIINDFEI